MSPSEPVKTLTITQSNTAAIQYFMNMNNLFQDELMFEKVKCENMLNTNQAHSAT